MIRRIKKLIKEFRERDEYIKKQNNELIWAEVFHDTIKDREWLRSLSLSPGRWAADYSFLYLLVRMLTDYKPQRIIEFGLGESSKIISAFADNLYKDINYKIIEQDEDWIKIFREKFKLSEKAQIIHMPLEQKIVKGNKVNSYEGINEKINDVFDIYIVDGPHGSPNYSRYDICEITKLLQPSDEFIIMIDDYNRNGEKETVSDLMNLFSNRNFTLFTGEFTGIKTQFIIATKAYKFILSA